MSKARKLFDRLLAGQNDANFAFDDLCSLLTHLGYSSRRTKGSHVLFQRGKSFFNLQPVAGGKSLPSSTSSGRIEKA